MRHPIQINNLFFGYTKEYVLENVNLVFESNRFYGLVGPNGGGKTTILKLILGLLQPTKGSIKAIDRSEMGYLPQTFFFDPKFPINVYEFVLMGALKNLNKLGRWPKEIKAQAKELINEVQMTPFINTPLGTLSGGQRQRASLARALLSNPKILLLDEPLTGLDANSRKFLIRKLTDLKGTKTIIVVTHVLDDLFDQIDEIINVQKTTNTLDKQSICEHTKLGIYHQK